MYIYIYAYTHDINLSVRIYDLYLSDRMVIPADLRPKVLTKDIPLEADKKKQKI